MLSTASALVPVVRPASGVVGLLLPLDAPLCEVVVTRDTAGSSSAATTAPLAVRVASGPASVSCALGSRDAAVVGDGTAVAATGEVGAFEIAAAGAAGTDAGGEHGVAKGDVDGDATRVVPASVWQRTPRSGRPLRGESFKATESTSMSSARLLCTPRALS